MPPGYISSPAAKAAANPGMGMNMSVAITVFIQQSLQRGKLPFEVVGDPFYSDSNMREIERRARDMDAHQNVAKPELLET